ncbi:MAG TPA: class I SAM-dependent methyltransferase [Leeuwenhoekiella sp.]|nr:class I SAM-dependent methyltransferase [Leeuwenhoekiella sp.]
MRQAIKKHFKTTFFEAPKSFKQKQIKLNEQAISTLRDSLEENYLDRGSTKEKLTTQEYQNAIQNQLHDRLYYNRNRIAPWLNHFKKLKNARILEIGCGTGISTQALTEQGAKVTGIDVDEGALKVAKDRLRIVDLPADFHYLNADQIGEKFKDQPFDFIIYYAVIEHMTIKERIASLKQAWEMLPDDAFLVVLETPNRLWYYDSHTAALPFFDWLPNELAFQYSKFSKRNNFKDLFRELDENTMLEFLRWGKGASYHEFELAIKPLDQLNIVSSLMKFEKTAFLKLGLEGLKYINFLKSVKKDLPKSFCYPYLDVILKKEAN